MKLAKLCLHTGGQEVPFAELENVQTPAATETHFPIAHHEFVSRVRNGLADASLQVVGESHALAKGGNRYFGLFQIAPNGATETDHAFIMGLRNSHDKVFPAGICVGSQVFVCDNLAFSAEIKVMRKHTLNIFRDLPGRVNAAVGRLNDAWGVQSKRFEAYKNTNLSDMQAHDLMIRALENRACNVTALSEVVDGWRNPPFEEFANGNVWRLFNSFTHALKGNLGALPGRTMALHSLLDGFCGLTAKPVEVEVN